VKTLAGIFWPWILWVEVFVCFAPVLLMLLAGIVFMPLFMDSVLSASVHIATVLCGIAGTVALVTLLRGLTFQYRVPRRTTLILICLGVLGVAGFIAQPITYPARKLWHFVLFFALPLFGTIHIMFAARHLLFGGTVENVRSERDRAK
jgi:hypothetical protein